MRFIRSSMLIVATILAAAISVLAFSQDSAGRKEFKRVDLSGAPDMEVISSINEYKPGEGVGLHFHHGIETGYVVQGAMVQSPGKEPVMLPTGAPIMNLRDVPHAGFTVVGEQSLKIYTVHVVDKGKPLYDWVK